MKALIKKLFSKPDCPYSIEGCGILNVKSDDILKSKKGKEQIEALKYIEVKK